MGRESKCKKFARRLRAIAMIMRGRLRAEAARAQAIIIFCFTPH